MKLTWRCTLVHWNNGTSWRYIATISSVLYLFLYSYVKHQPKSTPERRIGLSTSFQRFNFSWILYLIFIISSSFQLNATLYVETTVFHTSFRTFIELSIRRFVLTSTQAGEKRKKILVCLKRQLPQLGSYTSPHNHQFFIFYSFKSCLLVICHDRVMMIGEDLVLRPLFCGYFNLVKWFSLIIHM